MCRKHMTNPGTDEMHPQRQGRDKDKGLTTDMEREGKELLHIDSLGKRAGCPRGDMTQ